MSGPERYCPHDRFDGCHNGMERRDEGCYVLFKDYETVVRERDGLARDCDGLRAELNFARDDIRELAGSRDELRALLDEAQRDADRYRWLRDVWWLGDDYFDTPDPMAHANSADEFDAAIDEARIPRAGG